jgi:hypothetical protein
MLVAAWRVKMRKFLLTAYAFGLLLSFAFAQEYSKEEIESGVQRLEYTRHVSSGAKRTLDFLAIANPDCSIPEGFEVRKTEDPQHGTVEILPTRGFARWAKDNPRSKCNDRKIQGFNLNYKSADGYHGPDGFDILMLYPNGYAREVHYNMDVR